MTSALNNLKRELLKAKIIGQAYPWEKRRKLLMKWVYKGQSDRIEKLDTYLEIKCTAMPWYREATRGATSSNVS